jgi:hypothetical protein
LQSCDGRQDASSALVVEGVVSVSVVEAVTAELERLGEPGASSSLAATALALAEQLDEPRNGATSKSMCAKAMVDVLRELRLLAPPKQEDDELDRARKQRTERLARQSASEAAPPS